MAIKLSKRLSGQLQRLPDQPGVYFFRQGRTILYIGKATSLRSRVRSYFTSDLQQTRGPKIAAMIQLVTKIDYRQTDSVLEALLLETELIKNHQPAYNTIEKDDKSFYYVAMTDEAWPRVLLKRGRELAGLTGRAPKEFLDVIGPFPSGGEIRAGLKIIRRLFPWRDQCLPNPPTGGGRPCFNAQIGLCPGVCAGWLSQADYRRQIKQLRLFFHGGKLTLVRGLEREMKQLAAKQQFEAAAQVKRRLFALKHIQDVTMITDRRAEAAGPGSNNFRVEAYDVAHLAGAAAVGVLTVATTNRAGGAGESQPADYRRFRLRQTKPGDDYGGLREILARRFRHLEWPPPDLVAVDGGAAQLKVARQVLAGHQPAVPVVAVTKDEHHRPKEIIGDKHLAAKYESAILLANAEAHRFALKYHRHRRRQQFR